jgi:hypothetical protein
MFYSFYREKTTDQKQLPLKDSLLFTVTQEKAQHATQVRK